MSTVTRGQGGTTFWVNPIVIDPLGAETPEQTAERKAAERKPSLGIAHVLSIVATMLVVAALFTVVGAFYGASDPDAVKDLMPSVPSLSGERAEPEESAR